MARVIEECLLACWERGQSTKSARVTVKRHLGFTPPREDIHRAYAKFSETYA